MLHQRSYWGLLLTACVTYILYAASRSPLDVDARHRGGVIGLTTEQVSSGTAGVGVAASLSKAADILPGAHSGPFDVAPEDDALDAAATTDICRRLDSLGALSARDPYATWVIPRADAALPPLLIVANQSQVRGATRARGSVVDDFSIRLVSTSMIRAVPFINRDVTCSSRSYTVTTAVLRVPDAGEYVVEVAVMDVNLPLYFYDSNRKCQRSDARCSGVENEPSFATCNTMKHSEMSCMMVSRNVTIKAVAAPGHDREKVLPSVNRFWARHPAPTAACGGGESSVIKSEWIWVDKKVPTYFCLDEAQQCLGNKKIWYIGDSLARELWAVSSDGIAPRNTPKCSGSSNMLRRAASDAWLRCLRLRKHRRP